MKKKIKNSKELNKIISEQNNVVIPNFEGKNGHPIKLGIDFWKNLCSLDLNDKSSSSAFNRYIPKRWAIGAKISSVSLEILVCLACHGPCRALGHEGCAGCRQSSIH